MLFSGTGNEMGDNELQNGIWVADEGKKGQRAFKVILSLEAHTEDHLLENMLSLYLLDELVYVDS